MIQRGYLESIVKTGILEIMTEFVQIILYQVRQYELYV